MTTFKRFCERENHDVNDSFMHIEDVSDLEGIEQFAKLATLVISKCPQLTEIKNLPNGINLLTIHQCEKLNSIHSFPPNLESLSISKCPLLNELKNLPETVTDINIVRCEKMKNIVFKEDVSRILDEMTDTAQSLVQHGCMEQSTMEVIQELKQVSDSQENKKIISKQEKLARKLIDQHRKIDNLITVAYMLCCEEDIKLIEVTRSVVPTGEISPFCYTVNSMLVKIIILHPDELFQIEQGKLELPTGWLLSSFEIVQ